MKHKRFQNGFGMIGLLLSVSLLIFFIYLSIQGYKGSGEEGGNQSTYQQGQIAIEDAEEVKGLLETRYQ